MNRGDTKTGKGYKRGKDDKKGKAIKGTGSTDPNRYVVKILNHQIVVAAKRPDSSLISAISC